MPSEALVLELLARGGAVGAFVALALVILRGPPAPARATGFLFCLAAAAHTLTQHPASGAALGPAFWPVWALSVMGSGLFWAFAGELFEDRPRPAPGRFAPAALLLGIGIAARLAPRPMADGLQFAQHLVSAALMAHVVVIVWTGWQSDLVESRRRLRGPLLAAGALYALAVIAVETVEIFWRQLSELSPLAAATLFILGLGGIGALLRTEPDLFAAPAGMPDGMPDARANPLPLPPNGVSGEDGRAADKLDRLMRTERLYRQENLSIGVLAAKLGTPEYKLRRLINQRLGYRNFTAYLNKWRLAEATEALADPAQREVPISTIALDAGFQSLGPFNRAFKAETGLTPSEFRAQARGVVAPGATAAPDPAA